MIRRLMTLLIFALLLASCGSTPGPDTSGQAPTQAPAGEPEATKASVATETPPATATAAPTATPEATATADVPAGQIIGGNFVGSQDINGLKIEIGRVLIGTKEALIADGVKALSGDAFNDYNVVGELVFRVTNNYKEKISVYPTQGTVIIGSEQIDLGDWLFQASFGDAGGDIFPGVSQVGGIWFGIKRSKVEDIKSMRVVVNAPFEFHPSGDYEFEIDLSDHAMPPPIPEELK